MTCSEAAKPKPPYRVLVCDDVATIRQGVQRLLCDAAEFHVVDEAAGGEESITKAIQLRPDLVLMDVSMPGLDGIEATRQILFAAPGTKVLAYSSDSAWSTVERMLGAGASGYVLKGSDPDELVRAARKVLAGERYLSLALPKPASRD